MEITSDLRIELTKKTYYKWKKKLCNISKIKNKDIES